ncbi:MAG: NYN domain-containing protein [Candidatus Krumholzibacteriia bacterium]
MSQPRETNLALFIDFDNVALGARDARQRFDIKLLLQRVLEKGKIIVKRAYADWHYYKEQMGALHEAAIELIEVPTPKISGKNSADIRLVVDAIDLCYSKDHIDTFVIVSGDSDFSPLVSKLRENNKRVLGIGMRNSSSHLLISNCDEFIFYDDIYRTAMGRVTQSATHVPPDKRKLFDFLVQTTQRLLQESRGMLYSSLIKDTMKRKQPDFNEANYGYSTFGDLLEDAKRYGLLTVDRDARAGGTWVVQGLGATTGAAGPKPAEPPTAAPATEPETASPRTRGRRRRGGRRGRTADQQGASGNGEETSAPADPGREEPDAPALPAAAGERDTTAAATGEEDRKTASDAGRSARQDRPVRQDPATAEAEDGARKKAKKTRRKAPRKTAASGERPPASAQSARPAAGPAEKTSEKPSGEPAEKVSAEKPGKAADTAPAEKAAGARSAKKKAAPRPARKTAKKTASKTAKKTAKKAGGAAGSDPAGSDSAGPSGGGKRGRGGRGRGGGTGGGSGTGSTESGSGSNQ